MGHSFDGHHPIRFRLLALIEALALRIVPHGKICCLHNRPGPILVAVLCIALALAFAVTQFLTADTPTVRRKIPHGRKAANFPRL